MHHRAGLRTEPCLVPFVSENGSEDSPTSLTHPLCSSYMKERTLTTSTGTPLSNIFWKSLLKRHLSKAMLQSISAPQTMDYSMPQWMGTTPSSPIILQGDEGAAKNRIIVTFNINIEHQTLNGMNYETGLTWSLKLSGYHWYSFKYQSAFVL